MKRTRSTTLISAFQRFRVSAFSLLVLLLSSCQNTDPATRAALLRIGETAVVRVLDAKFPPARSGKEVVPADGADTGQRIDPVLGPNFGVAP